MKRKEDIEVIHGSGNVFRDLKRPDVDVNNSKAFWPPRSSRCSTATG